MTSYAKLSSPHTHPRVNIEEWFHLILILQRFAILLLAPLAATLPLMMHSLQACNATLFNIRAGWFFSTTSLRCGPVTAR
jgi:hypothetical protein